MGLELATMPFQAEVVIDCNGHLLGRLASTVAKELLCGQKIVLVRCEELNISGELFRNKLKFESFRRKRANTNPKKGPFHYRSPADLVRRTCFVGIPPPFDKKKRMVVPQALRVTHLRPCRKYTVLKDLCNAAGWKYGEVVAKLEEKRTVRAAEFYKAKKAKAELRAKAIEAAAPKMADAKAVLDSMSYPIS